MSADSVLDQIAFPSLVTGERETKTCPHCVGIGVLEATDIFCGAGGSSLGLEFVCCPHCGRSLIRVTQAINHSRTVGGRGMTPTTTWRPVSVPGLESRYSVSDTGLVTTHRTGRILRDHLVGPYHRVCLWNGRKSRRFMVHVLVAGAFLGECPRGHEVNHVDGNPDHNWLGNLEYLTPSENVRHSFDVLGRVPVRGDRHGLAELNAELVVAMRVMAQHGASAAWVSRLLDVGESTAQRAIAGRTWEHVPKPGGERRAVVLTRGLRRAQVHVLRVLADGSKSANAIAGDSDLSLSSVCGALRSLSHRGLVREGPRSFQASCGRWVRMYELVVVTK